jgi:hypothetical protein
VNLLYVSVVKHSSKSASDSWNLKIPAAPKDPAYAISAFLISKNFNFGPALFALSVALAPTLHCVGGLISNLTSFSRYAQYFLGFFPHFC